MAGPTSVSIALALAQQMILTKRPNAGLLQPNSPINAAEVVGIWIRGQPESADFPNLPGQTAADSNSPNLIDANAIGCSLAYLSDCCARGIAWASILAAVMANPYLVLTSLPGAPSWSAFCIDMENAGWPQNNDPCGGFGVVFPHVATLAEEIVTAVLAGFGLSAVISDPRFQQAMAYVTELMSTPC